MRKLIARVTRPATALQLRHVAPVSPSRADGPVAAVYQQVERDFGMLAPPVALHAASPVMLAAAWTMLREALLASGRTDREAREVVAAGVSQANRCPYCMDVHGGTLAGLLSGPDAAAVLTGQLADLRDPRLRKLARWAAYGGPPPFPPEHGPELVGVAVVFHYLNRMVNVFLPDSPLPPAPDPVTAVLRRGAVRILAGLARRTVVPGESPGLLPPATVPPDLSWTGDRPHLVAAFARSAAVVDAAGERTVPASVRRLVTAQLLALTRPHPSWTRARPPCDTVGSTSASRACRSRTARRGAWHCWWRSPPTGSPPPTSTGCAPGGTTTVASSNWPPGRASPPPVTWARAPFASRRPRRRAGAGAPSVDPGGHTARPTAPGYRRRRLEVTTTRPVSYAYPSGRTRPSGVSHTGVPRGRDTRTGPVRQPSPHPDGDRAGWHEAVRPTRFHCHSSYCSPGRTAVSEIRPD
ncbi:carboxymuconolactone decarboxylase family protein [Micromonospora sp. CA-269861]|uniref:carboxymuconolactone decarboxylase family protein n=1 Tax=Micromonospora sp. CA-269861 TaxID=3239968 RepID=UPI003D92975B